MMLFSVRRRGTRQIRCLALLLIVATAFSTVSAQESSQLSVVSNRTAAAPEINERRVTGSSLALYFDPLQGESGSDLVRRALSSNGELAAARLDIDRARAR